MRPEPSRAAALFGPSPSRGHEGLAERLELEDRWALIGWMRADLIPAQKLQEQPELAQRAYVTERCAELSAQITPEPLKDPRQVLDYAAWARTLEPAYLDWSLPDHQARAETLYARHCASCHGADGAGGPDGVPPLAGSDWLKERAPEELVDVLLQGLRGEIVVNGRAYQGAMPGFADRLDDVELAAIASHVLTRWRPSGAPMAPDRVAARRGALALPPDPPGPNPRRRRGHAPRGRAGGPALPDVSPGSGAPARPRSRGPARVPRRAARGPHPPGHGPGALGAPAGRAGQLGARRRARGHAGAGAAGPLMMRL